MRRLKCMVIDDEPHIIERLQAFFAKHNDRFDLVASAQSGNEALEYARRLKPDIIVTDIVMPGMDGIELIRNLKTFLSPAYYIILSAYSDFEYAKQAIRLNVKDYIIKVPLSEEELLSSLFAAAELLTKEATRLYQHNRTRLEHVHRVRRGAFSEFFNDELMLNNLREQQHDMDICLPAGAYCCFLIRMHSYQSFLREYSGLDQSLVKYGMLNVIEEMLSSVGQGFAYASGDYDFVGFASWNNMQSSADVHMRSLELGHALIVNIETYMKQQVSVVFSGIYHELESMQDSFNQVKRLAEDLYYLKKKSVHIPSKAIVYHETNVSLEKSALEGLLTKDEETGFEYAGQAIDKLAHDMRAMPVAPALMQALIQDAASQLFLQANFSSADIVTYMEQFPIVPSLDDQLEWLMHIRVAALTVTGMQSRSEITRAKQYIAQHLMERLTLQQVASHVHLSSTYFSLLFKREVGINLKEYINQKKIERAAELLNKQDINNFILSEQVGINNERYFCTLFKQYYGVTPQKYRKQQLKKVSRERQARVSK